MISAGDFRNGTTFEMDGNVFRVVEFQHVKPGKGSAFVRTKLKNVISGAVIEKTFNPSEKYPAAQIEKKEMQYLYNDEDLYYFMDNDTYEQIPLNKEKIGDELKLIKYTSLSNKLMIELRSSYEEYLNNIVKAEVKLEIKKEKKEKASVKTLAKAIMPPGSTPDGMLLSGFQKKPHRSRYIYPKNLLGNNGYRLPFFPG